MRKLQVVTAHRTMDFCKVFIGIASSLKVVVNKINAKLFAFNRVNGVRTTRRKTTNKKELEKIELSKRKVHFVDAKRSY